MLPDSFVENLERNKQQRQFFALLLAAPERSFGPKELQIRLSVRPSALKKIIASGLRYGLLQAFQRRNIRFIGLKNHLPEKEELARLLRRLKTPKVKKDPIERAAKRLRSVRTVALSGLFTHSPHLSIDAVIVGKPAKKALKRFIKLLESLARQEVNYTVLTNAEFSYRRNIPDRFMKDLLEHPYWMIKGSL
jgi:hypothetical protein